ncbi:TetR family transcriptional regulator [Streptomyces sp. SID5785]|uniref:TetR/AcrR family transcriptional regulator n=1 Tax=Streptomyces sp. SID5785 TaxID=2690309 RepID=UPI00136112F4|nr:TetR/AcrR family transcriptional regulator [Streptomyces sp. SID5785]MZD05724.1 TetR family transcriptional regulator [Streptomyces sp. SID5785]
MPDPASGSSPAAPPRPRPRRSDAEGNRARIIDVARGAFTDDPDAPLHSIAKAAGVGQGTMYRHFPSRDALLLTVYRTDVEALVADARHLLAEHEQEPLEALRHWLTRLAGYGRSRCGASRAVEAATRTGLPHEAPPPVTAALDPILTACEEARQVRPGVQAPEVLLLVSFLWRAGGGPDGQGRTDRLLGIVIDGLRGPRSPGTPPGT